ncbi:hypothetical protein FPQ18DRAFT_339846 [Pyronema domesticum]|uniref:Riboflavin kinase n=1 Tax=Pyronema omphalodes (strain CBS 100304) TaxID=1076935 RepID=U4LNV0_PYROM|nr:hypothetical protein FPQ18DRAFT_339846 [Pyronema domesticum]CCX33262.1 Similar to Riboflavin kinase; acc. no. O74866 [Pyronema omphalodes CBS 100304]
MRLATTDRPLIVGPDVPEPPYPIRLGGPVVPGFGRGSKELQIPTANIPIDDSQVGGATIDSGIYFGFASLSLDEELVPNNVFPMVMSVGWNPYYKNEKRSVEVHIVHSFEKDFYGKEMRLCILGWIREEFDYVSKEALIEDIRHDIKIGVESLKREGYSRFKEDGYLLGVGKEEKN